MLQQPKCTSKPVKVSGASSISLCLCLFILLLLIGLIENVNARFVFLPLFSLINLLFCPLSNNVCTDMVPISQEVQREPLRAGERITNGTSSNQTGSEIPTTVRGGAMIQTHCRCLTVKLKKKYYKNHTWKIKHTVCLIGHMIL